MIEDLGSYNGTFVNGVRIDGPTEVHPGETIRISTSSLSLLPAADGDDERPRPAPEESSLPAGVTLIRHASDLLPGLQATPDPGREPDRLFRYAERLALLNDIHRALTGTTSLDGLLELILDRVFDHFRPDEAAIFLRRDDDRFDRVAVRTVGERPPEIESGSLEREVGTKGLSLVVLDARDDQRLAGSESILASGVRSLLAAPLIDSPLDGGQLPLGMIVLGAGLNTRPFTEGDMELLVSLASAAALRIRNAALAEEAMEHQRLEEELTLARSIQVALLTEALPEVMGWELWAGNVPSRRVSGDFYKVVDRETEDGTELVLLLADVSGKGMAASLLTAALEAMAAGLLDLGDEGRAPETICERLSRLLYRRTPPSKYATGFLGMIEATSGAPALHERRSQPGAAGAPGGWGGRAGGAAGLDRPTARPAARHAVLGRRERARGRGRAGALLRRHHGGGESGGRGVRVGAVAAGLPGLPGGAAGGSGPDHRERPRAVRRRRALRRRPHHRHGAADWLSRSFGARFAGPSAWGSPGAVRPAPSGGTARVGRRLGADRAPG